MNTKELRLGNWVTGKSDPPMRVAAISKGTVELYMPGSEGDNFHYDDKEIFGIKITPEILLNSGFNMPSNYPVLNFDKKLITLYKMSTIWIYFLDGKLNRVTSGSAVKEHRYIQYVHQLQNLVYALNYQEMRINSIP